MGTRPPRPCPAVLKVSESFLPPSQGGSDSEESLGNNLEVCVCVCVWWEGGMLVMSGSEGYGRLCVNVWEGRKMDGLKWSTMKPR